MYDIFIQTLGTSCINSLFETMSNNYDKIDLNKEYRIHLDNEEKTIIFVLKVNPKKFINLIFNKNY